MFSIRQLSALPVLAAMTITGCVSKVDYKRSTDEGASGNGIRFYESAAYVLIYSDGQGGVNWQIISMPDQTREMEATPVVKGGKGQMVMGFNNGAMNSGGATGDTTTIPNAVISAVQAFAPLAAAAFASQPLPPPTSSPSSTSSSSVATPAKPIGFPPPYLYKIRVSNNAVTFIGGPAGDSIRVPIMSGIDPTASASP